MVKIRYVTSERPQQQAMQDLLASAWGRPSETQWGPVLERSLCWVCAYHGERLVGFVNVAWDGGIHASIFDTSVHAEYQGKRIGTTLLQYAASEAAARGAQWLHVDFEPHLAAFYARAGFRPTQAGLRQLVAPG